jgi:hypothetical protein
MDQVEASDAAVAPHLMPVVLQDLQCLLHARDSDRCGVQVTKNPEAS